MARKQYRHTPYWFRLHKEYEVIDSLLPALEVTPDIITPRGRSHKPYKPDVRWFNSDKKPTTAERRRRKRFSEMRNLDLLRKMVDFTESKDTDKDDSYLPEYAQLNIGNKDKYNKKHKKHHHHHHHQHKKKTIMDLYLLFILEKKYIIKMKKLKDYNQLKD